MQELNRWSEAEIISPLLYAGAQSVEDEDFDCAEIGEQKKELIRAKVLESYRNGLAVGRREADRPSRPTRVHGLVVASVESRPYTFATHCHHVGPEVLALRASRRPSPR